MHAEMHFDNALASAGEVRHLSKEDTESRQSSSCRSLPCWRSRHWLCSFHSSASTSGAGPGRLLGADHLTTHGLHAGQNDCQNMWHLHYHRSKLCPLAGGLHLPVTTSIRATQLATITTLHWELLDGFDGCVMSFPHHACKMPVVAFTPTLEQERAQAACLHAYTTFSMFKPALQAGIPSRHLRA